MKPLSVPTIAAVVALAACGGSSKEIARAQDLVRQELSDPASAQFRGVRVKKIGDNPFTVCGEYNAKNRMGGYVGFKRFIVRIGSDQALLEAEDDTQGGGLFAASYDIACAP